MPANAATPAREVVIVPRDPIIVRDGRPFAATPGAQAVTLPWPLPGTVAGMLRTAIGTALQLDWSKPGGGAARARRIEVHGPLMLARRAGEDGWTVYLSAPRDALIVSGQSGKDVMHPRRPADSIPAGAGANLPDGLRPMKSIAEAGKPSAGYLYWPLDAYLDWLAEITPSRQPPDGCLGALPRDTRVHVAVDAATGTAREGALFATDALAFADAPRVAVDDARPAEAARALLCRVSTDEEWRPDSPGFATLGGERRLVELRPRETPALWPACPERLRGALAGRQRLRLVLATPALFEGGWKPGWLGDGLTGAPPGLPALRLRLAGAIVSRPEPVSGWDMELGRPKSVRHMAPAGSVYFFEVDGAGLEPDQVEALWLAAVSDGAQDRADGFGLALPGLW